MKESIGYTVSLNIIIVFIVIVFAFIGGSISYYKAYKVNSLIEDEIEKYEGYNELSQVEINKKLISLGYNISEVNCGYHEVYGVTGTSNMKGQKTALNNHGKGYCVYYNIVKCRLGADGKPINDEAQYNGYCKPESYNYIIKTYLRFSIPIINTWLKIPVYNKTNAIYACYGNQC